MSIELMQRDFERSKAKWAKNPDLVKRMLEAFGNASISRLVCFDVSLQTSMCYFAALMAIVDDLEIANIKYIAQNPDYTDVDKALLRHHGYGIADYPDAISHVDENTLVVCINPSTQTIDATSQGPQPAMLVIHDSLCTPEILANFDQHTLPIAGDPGTWSLHVRKASMGQHKYGIDTGIEEPEPIWMDAAAVMLHSDLVGIAVPNDELVAECLIRRKVKESVCQYGPDDERTLRTCDVLAGLYLKQHKYSEARVILQRSLIFNVEKYGHYHILTLASLGSRCATDKDLIMTEPLRRAVLRGLEEARGLDYNMTAFAARDLGGLLMKRKEYAESEEMFEKALVYFRGRVPKERRLGHVVMRGLYVGLMNAKSKRAEHAASNGDEITQYAKLLELDALATESGLKDSYNTSEGV